MKGTIDWSLDRLGALARVTYYGDVNQPGTTPAAEIHTAGFPHYSPFRFTGRYLYVRADLN